MGDGVFVCVCGSVAVVGSSLLNCCCWSTTLRWCCCCSLPHPHAGGAGSLLSPSFISFPYQLQGCKLTLVRVCVLVCFMSVFFGMYFAPAFAARQVWFCFVKCLLFVSWICFTVVIFSINTACLWFFRLDFVRSIRFLQRNTFLTWVSEESELKKRTEIIARYRVENVIQSLLHWFFFLLGGATHVSSSVPSSSRKFSEKVQEYNKSKEMWFTGVINKSNKEVFSLKDNESVWGRALTLYYK